MLRHAFLAMLIIAVGRFAAGNNTQLDASCLAVHREIQPWKADEVSFLQNKLLLHEAKEKPSHTDGAPSCDRTDIRCGFDQATPGVTSATAAKWIGAGPARPDTWNVEVDADNTGGGCTESYTSTYHFLEGEQMRVADEDHHWRWKCNRFAKRACLTQCFRTKIMVDGEVVHPYSNEGVFDTCKCQCTLKITPPEGEDYNDRKRWYITDWSPPLDPSFCFVDDSVRWQYARSGNLDDLDRSSARSLGSSSGFDTDSDDEDEEARGSLSAQMTRKDRQ